MSGGSAGGVSAAADVISLSELDQLIKFLGLLGSAHDGEALNAARFACRWLEQHQTDWRTLLTPEEEIGVSGVVAVADQWAAEEALAQRCDEAYQRGIRAGMDAMKAQLKAQAAYAGLGQAAGLGPFYSGYGGHPAQNAAMGGLGALGGGLGGAAAPGVFSQGPAAAAAHAPSQGPPGAPSGALWQPGTWQRVCQDLLDRAAQGIPGVFRGTREEQFVADVLGRGFKTLTAAQETWLRDIAGRSGMSW